MAKKHFIDGYKRYDTRTGYGDPSQWRAALRERMTKDEAVIILNNQPLTPWEILGVERDATTAQIKAARNSLIKRWHPDRNPDNTEEAIRKSVEINAAYTFLTD